MVNFADILEEHWILLLVTRRLLVYNLLASNHWKNGIISVIDRVWNRSDYLFCTYLFWFICSVFPRIWITYRDLQACYWVLSWPVFGYLSGTNFAAPFDSLQQIWVMLLIFFCIQWISFLNMPQLIMIYQHIINIL